MDNPATNLAYPEESAIYWGARFRLPAGATLVLDGKYPHARFMSLNAYLDKGATDDLIDTEIKPSKGSVNPYKAGANRYAPKRAYRVAVPGPNTTPRGFTNVLDSPADGTKIQELIYRVYMPDAAGDRSVGSLPKPSVRLRSGKVLRGTKACRAINDSQRYFQHLHSPRQRGRYRSCQQSGPGSAALGEVLQPLARSLDLLVRSDRRIQPGQRQGAR
jgi:hypothetical protein